MKKLFPLLLCAASFTPLALQAQNDITISGILDVPDGGYYQLSGQSAFLQYFTSGLSTGGQLDNITSGSFGIGFTEVFSPPPLEDYVAYSYFGRILTFDANDNLVDTSFIMALQPGTGIGSRVGDYFSYTESDLVSAFATFDSAEFLDILVGVDGIDSVPTSKGGFTIQPLGLPGTTLDLIAFIGGLDGEEGVKVGSMSVEVVPEPHGAVLLGLLGVIALFRRRD